MISSIQASNINQAFTDVFWIMRSSGVPSDSRNGPVLRSPGPFITEFSNPNQRVLFNKRRDANHVFHLVEAIWMFAGRDDAEFLLPFNSGYGKYAESDGRIHGAYGRRWRYTGVYDQIMVVIRTLELDPNSRQAVISMWDPDKDLLIDVNDRPCNTHIYFEIRSGQLNMTVCNRSNDILWGAYGANVVHMSMLQELIAAGLGVPVGYYWQISNNFHLYTDNEMVKDFLLTPPTMNDLYGRDKVTYFPIISGNETVRSFLWDCEVWCGEQCPVQSRFINEVVDPLAQAYLARKRGESFSHHMAKLDDRLDWKVGFEQWLENRSKK